MGALKAMIRRFQTVVGAETFVGRWTGEEFVAILDMEAAGAMLLTRDVSKKLSGGYAVQDNATSHNVAVEVTTGVVERGASADAASMVKKLEQMSGALAQS